ncbi:oligosaccharide flippase family protein [Staphylococcus sp. EZ-P03]|uniref:oligosaccharide flippase family protein n=1 Tax=Staphylococcus sp. EZ-P03 TaxID=2282739 RepID=UPI000DF7B34F|nr:oligosaccharide flippase family protein [Staphylococcus sp. EZ-P03]
MIKDSFYYLLSKGLPAILSFAVLFLYLTNMNPKDYGFFSVTILTVGLVNIVTSQWVRSGMLRYYNEQNGVMNTAISVQFLIIALLSIIAMTIMISLKLNILSSFLILIILMSFIVNEFLNNYFRVKIMPKTILNGNLIKNIIYVLVLAATWLISKKITLNEAFISFLAGLILSNLYFFCFFNDKVNFKINRNLLKVFMVYGLPLTVSFALGVLLQNIDKYMITYQLGVTKTGDYSLVYDFVHNSLYMVMGALGMASLPRILKITSIEERIKSFNKYVMFLYLISIPFVGMFFAVSPDLAKIFGKFGYDTTALILIMIVTLTFIHGINSFVYGQAIQMMENTKIIFIPAAIAVVINIVLNLILLPRLGLISAAISGVIAFLASNILLYKLIAQKLPLKFLPNKIGSVLIVMIIGTIPIFFIHFNNMFVSLFVKIILSLGIQMVIFYILIKTKKLNLRG